MARMWDRIAALGRKRTSSSRTNINVDAESCSTSVASKYHVVVYTADQRRYMIPLVYLSNNIFRELFMMSEEFGLTRDVPITLPCASDFREYIILIQRGMAKDIEKAFLVSIAIHPCSLPSSHHGHLGHEILICGY